MVLNGIDRIGQYDAVLKGKRLGLITSISGVNNSLCSSIDILSEKYTLAALYSPEHGVRGNVAAGGIVDTYKDPYSGIMVYSLYRSDSKRFTDEMLKGIDALVYDIQDVGTRYYTFISTMYYACQECEKRQMEFIILDRLNPLGDAAEGVLLQEGYESFVGAYPICMRYGLTVGELAKMIYDEQGYTFPLTVIPVDGWQRTMLFPATGNLWIMPSLGLPRFETALLYPGTCLFEGTNLSEGRGTSAPFELIGAPYVDGYRFAKYMNERKLPGVLFSPAYFTPTTSKHTGEACEGVHIHVTDMHTFEACRTGLELLFGFREIYPEHFAFLPPLHEGGRKGIELLFGDNAITREDMSLQNLLEKYYQDSNQFAVRKEKYHIYT